MAGGFPRTFTSETNIRLDPSAAVEVTKKWPGEILWQGYEVGLRIITGTGLKKTPKENPVRRAYELRPYYNGKAIDFGKPSCDQASALMAVRGAQKEYYRLSEWGKSEICSDGNTQWWKDKNGNQRYVILKSHPIHLENIIEELMSKPPKK